MTQEIVFDQKNNLSVSVNTQHVLLNEPAFKRPDAYLHNLILAEILKSYAHLMWLKPNDGEIFLMVNQLKSSVQTKYKQIRAEELPDIFSDGIRKVYGDFMGLSIVTFEMFIMGYLESQKRKQLALNIPKEEVKQVPSKEERFKIACKNAMDAFLAFQIGKDISMQSPVVYRFLRRLELFKYSDEEQVEFMDRARVMVLSELKNKKEVTLDKFRRLDIEKMINGEMSIEEKVIAQAQRLGLYAYFQELQFNETDLQEIINSKWKQ